MTNIYQVLKTDHDAHRKLLDKLADTSGDSAARQKHWDEFYISVSAHAAAEEEALYSPLMEDPKGQSGARHSVAEHKELDDIMQELEDMDMSSPGWLTRFKTLRHDYEHHIEEEENDIFPIAKQVLGQDRDGKMAGKFNTRKEKEKSLVEKKAEDALTE